MNAAKGTAWKRRFVFGSGLGIAIRENLLEVAVVKLRPAGPSLAAETTIADFRNRPAAEWGAELAAFLKRSGDSSLPATLLLPRSSVIVRTLSLPGVSDQDVTNAIAIQAEAMHPWGDEEVATAWCRSGAGTVMVGLARKSVLDEYETLFSEAGVALGAVSFTPGTIFRALRVWSEGPGTLLSFHGGDRGRCEVYGESEGRNVYSAEFPAGLERALAVSRSELRLDHEFAAVPLAEAVHTQGVSSYAWVAAVAGGAQGGRLANLLPVERRASQDRMQYVLPAILLTALLAGLAALLLVLPALERKRYREQLDRAARAVEPSALKAQAVERAAIAARNRLAALDVFRRRPQEDLELLNELTRLLPPPVWTSSIDIFPDSVMITGEADQAGPLLKILDSSPFFEKSEFTGSVSRLKDAEQFHIRAMRRGRTGRKTP